MKQKILEKYVLKECLEYLAYRPGFYWRNQTGALKAENRYVRFGAKGSPDIIGVFHGRFVGIECKGSGGKLSEDQKHFGDMITHCGGMYVVAYGFEDIKKAGI